MGVGEQFGWRIAAGGHRPIVSARLRTVRRPLRAWMPYFVCYVASGMGGAEGHAMSLYRRDVILVAHQHRNRRSQGPPIEQAAEDLDRSSSWRACDLAFGPVCGDSSSPEWPA